MVKIKKMRFITNQNINGPWPTGTILLFFIIEVCTQNLPYQASMKIFRYINGWD
jgi:hypothetical protein